MVNIKSLEHKNSYILSFTRNFTKKIKFNHLPLIAKPLKPTAIVRKAIAILGVLANATTSKKIASSPKP